MLVLLAVNDEERFAVMRNTLKQCGCNARKAETPSGILELMEGKEYDAAVVSSDVPGLDVLSLLRIVRGDGVRAPVMVVCHGKDVNYVVDCLEAGADDVMTVPLYPAEFQARCKAMLRRKDVYTADTLVFGDLTMDGARITVTSSEGTVNLTRKEFQLLRLLISNPGGIFSTEDLKARLWGADYLEGNYNVVWTTVSSLRRKLKQTGSTVKMKCIRHFGYSLSE